MLEIRRLNTVDEFNKGITALTEIFIEEYPYYSKWIEKNSEQFRTGEKQILSIVNEKDIIGYIMIHFCTENIVKINGIYIFEDYKGKGFATKAISDISNYLKAINVQMIFIQTRLDNNAVVHLFDKCNYKLIGTNYHAIEKKDNWVACNCQNSKEMDMQKIAQELYDGFCPLSYEEIQSLRNKHKAGNLILTRKKK